MIDHRIWHDKPKVAAAVLGYCDGKLGHPATPPSTGVAEYMREYAIGVAQRKKA